MIIFVCVENSNRSQMAEAFAHIHGLQAVSAGSKPSGVINPKAIKSMLEVGYDLTKHKSKGLEEFKNQEFDIVVTMGCGDECPFLKAKLRLNWNIPDPKEMSEEEFRGIRDLIDLKVKELINHSFL